jgi:hypothetical protein
VVAVLAERVLAEVVVVALPGPHLMERLVAIIIVVLLAMEELEA